MKPFGALLAIAALVMPANGAQRRQCDWPQLGRDAQRTNYTPEPLGRFASIKGWEMAWAWKTPKSPVAIRTQVVASEGVVAVGTHDGVPGHTEPRIDSTDHRLHTAGTILQKATDQARA